MPLLSFEKCGAMQGGYHQPNNNYVIRGTFMSVLDSFKDPSAKRSANGLHNDQRSATEVKVSNVVPSSTYSNRKLLNSNGQLSQSLFCQCLTMGRKFGTHTLPKT